MTADPLTILQGDALTRLRELPDESVQCVVTSPPYWALRDYQCAGQIGLEKSPAVYLDKMVTVFREVRRVLRSDGTCWVNMGDCYATGAGAVGNCPGGGEQGAKWRGDETRRDNGRPFVNGRGEPQSTPTKNTVGPMTQPNRMPIEGLKPKDLCGMPWRLAFALQADGWWLRSDIIWHKPNPMPESVQGSHFSRHLVTIEEYENLSGLRYEGERAGDKWAGDMPKLSEIESAASKAPLSAQREGDRHGSCKRGARRGKGETKAVQPIGQREEKQIKIRGDAQRYRNASEGDGEIQCQPAIKVNGGGTPQGDQGSSAAVGAAEKSEHQVSEESAREGAIQKAVRAEEGSNSLLGESLNGTGLVGDNGGAQIQMSLLPEEAKTDDGSCDSPDSRRAAHEIERGSSLPAVQQREEGPPLAAVLVGCPGCAKCEQHHGYILHLSAGRPTKAHEYLFLLTKSERYFYDQEAIREAASNNTHERQARAKEDHKANADRVVINGIRPKKRVAGWMTGPGSHKAVDHAIPGGRYKERKLALNGSGTKNNASFDEAMAIMPDDRNKRSVWTVPTFSYAEAHFATYPPDLIRPCILAGTSARGACDACLAPWLRVVEKGAPNLEHQRACGGDVNGEYHGEATKDFAAGKAQDASATKARILAGMRERVTVDWVPSCKCAGAGVVPCTVLDPFAGSGTTGMVALEHGRRAVLIELNPSYCDLIRKRCSVTVGLGL